MDSTASDIAAVILLLFAALLVAYWTGALEWLQSALPGVKP
jgi:sensor domain CHASE-containing protein